MAATSPRRTFTEPASALPLKSAIDALSTRTVPASDGTSISRCSPTFGAAFPSVRPSSVSSETVVSGENASECGWNSTWKPTLPAAASMLRLSGTTASPSTRAGEPRLLVLLGIELEEEVPVLATVIYLHEDRVEAGVQPRGEVVLVAVGVTRLGEEAQDLLAVDPYLYAVVGAGMPVDRLLAVRADFAVGVRELVVGALEERVDTDETGRVGLNGLRGPDVAGSESSRPCRERASPSLPRRAP